MTEAHRASGSPFPDVAWLLNVRYTIRLVGRVLAHNIQLLEYGNAVVDTDLLPMRGPACCLTDLTLSGRGLSASPVWIPSQGSMSVEQESPQASRPYQLDRVAMSSSNRDMHPFCLQGEEPQLFEVNQDSFLTITQGQVRINHGEKQDVPRAL